MDESKFIELKKYWGYLAGENYIYTEFNKPVLNKLMAYFTNDERMLDYEDLNPFKSIMLVGPKGNGKTTIFTIFEKFLKDTNSERRIENTSIERMKQHYLLNKNMDYYAYNKFDGFNTQPKEFAIHEFGTDSKIYGESFNEIISGVMMLRYELFCDRGVNTHLTTNFDADDLKNKFDPILIDRFKEMYNIIELKGNSFRK